ncbi:thioredoxin domain-containing protein-like [Rhopilema esculentum]|uniref:thioredoxin domain-containing protein-like n=1 Tax=Rhopilema esculentum TaxID=499914 RepID=UPI0031DA1FB3
MAAMQHLSLVVVFLFCQASGQDEQMKTIILDDDNFEHLTQASTGATTGDWLVLFSKNEDDCLKCAEAKDVFSSLTERLSTRLNVALIDAQKNQGLLRRFKINTFPSIYFFRHGFQFAYLGSIDQTKLENFALGGYRDVRKEAVTKPLSTFDIWLEDTTQEIMVSIKERKLPSTSTIGIAAGTFLLCLAFLFCCCSGTRPEPVTQAKKRQ